MSAEYCRDVCLCLSAHLKKYWKEKGSTQVLGSRANPTGPAPANQRERSKKAGMLGLQVELRCYSSHRKALKHHSRVARIKLRPPFSQRALAS